MHSFQLIFRIMLIAGKVSILYSGDDEHKLRKGFDWACSKCRNQLNMLNIPQNWRNMDVQQIQKIYYIIYNYKTCIWMCIVPLSAGQTIRGQKKCCSKSMVGVSMWKLESIGLYVDILWLRKLRKETMLALQSTKRIGQCLRVRTLHVMLCSISAVLGGEKKSSGKDVGQRTGKRLTQKKYKSK